MAEMKALAQKALAETYDANALKAQLHSIAQGDFMDDSAVQEALVSAWEDGVHNSLEDGLLTAEARNRLAAYMNAFTLEQSALDRNGVFMRFAKGAVLSELMEGKLPHVNINVTGLHVLLQKGEMLIWVFDKTEYFEDRVRREYVGGYQGASIRVAKGMYWRVGGFRGRPIEHTELTHIDTGTLAVTNNHIYFVGPHKSLRIRHDKIISLIPYSDGVGLHRDAASAKPQAFRTGDGWFTYNLLSNIHTISPPGA
jgi:hypothetical protein